ncbi:MAG: 4-hydroxybenzoate octaprenyltransferase [Pseudomonadales bacterium]
MNLFAHPLWPANLQYHPVIGPYWRLLRLEKPVGSLLILWPTLASLWIAGQGHPAIGLVIIFALGTFLMRSAGCAINDFADRNFDGKVTRTTQRPLATGELQPKQAIYAFLILCAISFGLVLLTNQLTVYLSFAGAALAAIYPFLKRITHLPQIWLGLSMNWGIIMAYSAQANTLHPGIGVFYAATLLWTVVYDCFYAMVDREDDLKIGVKSIAILFGEHDRLFCGILQLMSVFAFYLAGQRLELGTLYYLLTVGGVFILFAYQQYLARERDRAGCFAAFMNNRWVALLIFVGVFADTSF